MPFENVRLRPYYSGCVEDSCSITNESGKWFTLLSFWAKRRISVSRVNAWIPNEILRFAQNDRNADYFVNRIVRGGNLL